MKQNNARSKIFPIIAVILFIAAGHITLCGATQYETEFNDTQLKALHIQSFGTQVIGSLWHPLDYDWYSFSVQNPGSFKISVVYEDAQSEEVVSNALFIEVRDGLNNILGGFPVDFGSSDQTYQGSLSIGSAGTYYLVVFCPSVANHHNDQYKISVYDNITIDPSNPQTLNDPHFLSLSLSQSSVKSDNSDSTEITAIVLDGYHVPIEEAKVTFEVAAGQISSAFPLTDAEGKAIITFSSGNLDKTNQVVVIKASVLDTDPLLTKEIPIVISGSTLSIDPGLITNLEIGGDDTTILTITAKDAGNNTIPDAAISVFSDESSGSGLVFLDDGLAGSENTPFEGKTDYLGQLKVTVKAFAQGDITLKVQGLGVTATQNYSIYSSGDALHIIEPEKESIRLSIYNDTDPIEGVDYAIIKVFVPDYLIEQVEKKHTIRFISTLGSFSEVNDEFKPTGGWEYPLDISLENSLLKDFSDSQKGVVVAYKSDQAGTASIYTYDIEDVVQNDSLTSLISASAKDAFQISFQAEPTIVSPTITEDNKGTSDLIVTIKNDNDQVVGGATVVFTINNPTGGGETVSPIWTTTDSSGIARATFTSGSLSSGGEGIEITAEVLDADKQGIKDSVEIVIGGTPGSIVIGRSTEVQSDETNTYYILPMSLLVADAGGHPVANQDVSLNNWPSEYNTGVWIPGDPCLPEITGTFPNEDQNRNMILDQGEDLNGDVMITPPNSSAGDLPKTVTTDENGVVGFNLIYLKGYAAWIQAEIRANTIVAGTETKSVLAMILPWASGDGCYLPDSPFEPPIDDESTDDEPIIDVVPGSIEFVSADPTMIALGGIANSSLPPISIVTFLVKDTEGNPMSSASVVFNLSTEVGGLTISHESTVTDSEGYAQVVVTAGSVATHVRVRATIEETSITTVSDSLVVSTGMPDQNSFSLSADIYGPEGWNYDGEIVSLTIRAADHFNNPVPDGTSVYFTAEGGSIEPSCTTFGGTCSVIWTSQNPRPFDGKATILATTVGEESFIDLDGNGRYDEGDTLIGDLPEAYLDVNDNGHYDKEFEEFIDFDGDGEYTAGNNKYNGTLCNTGNCVDDLLHIRQSLELVMAGSNAKFEPNESTITLNSDNSYFTNFIVTITDKNENAMPYGTTVVFTAPDNAEILGTSSFTIANLGDIKFELYLKAKDTTEDSTGILQVKVTTPNGIMTESTYSVEVEAP